MIFRCAITLGCATRGGGLFIGAIATAAKIRAAEGASPVGAMLYICRLTIDISARLEAIIIVFGLE